MGATPLAAFLSLALPAPMVTTAEGRAWIEHFFAGLQGLAEMHRVPWREAIPPSPQAEKMATSSPPSYWLALHPKVRLFVAPEQPPATRCT